MGLLTILRKIKQKEKEIRVLILGLDNAGKTTAVRRLLISLEASRREGEPPPNEEEKDEGASPSSSSSSSSPLDQIEPTLGFNIQTLEHRGYRINLWDVGGQKTIRAYWRNYFEKTDGVVWVVDSADRERLLLCRDELHQLLRHERLMGATLLVLANKQDVPGACSSRDIERILMSAHHGDADPKDDGDVADDAASDADPRHNIRDGSPLFQNRHWNILPCSAATGMGLEEGMDWLITDIASRIFLLA